MTTMLEKAAKAFMLRRRYGERADIEPDHPKHLEYWEQLDATTKNEVMRNMASALRALRPLGKYSTAASPEYDPVLRAIWDKVGIDQDPYDYWTAAIDAILGETK